MNRNEYKVEVYYHMCDYVYEHIDIFDQESLSDIIKDMRYFCTVFCAPTTEKSVDAVHPAIWEMVDDICDEYGTKFLGATMSLGTVAVDRMLRDITFDELLGSLEATVDAVKTLKALEEKDEKVE